MIELPKLIPSEMPPDAKEVDFSIVIPHHGPVMGLWATIESCLIELEGSPHDFNFVIVSNGEKITLEHKKIKTYLRNTRHFRDWIHTDEPKSPPGARQIGSDWANGRVLFFFDNHCLPARGYFDRGLAALARPDVDLVHSTTRYYSGHDMIYHYNLNLPNNFWSTGCYEAQDYENPYRVAMAGHGGFAVKASAWKEVRGYWNGFYGYAGEESYLDLKMWLFGKSVWLDPKMVHVHFAGDRPYPRHYSDAYFRNLLMAANMIGGYDWMMRVFESFRHKPRMRPPDGGQVVSLFDIMTDAYDSSRDHAEWIAQRRTQTLDDLLEWFTRERIAQ